MYLGGSHLFGGFKLRPLARVWHLREAGLGAEGMNMCVLWLWKTYFYKVRCRSPQCDCFLKPPCALNNGCTERPPWEEAGTLEQP